MTTLAPGGARDAVVQHADSPGLSRVLAAWFALAIVDGALRLGGIQTVMRLLDRAGQGRAQSSHRQEQLRAAADCLAVDRAKLLYPRRVRCLQAAAAAALLLRRSHLPGILVVGVRRVPFRAHAWVELNGTVLINNEDGQMDLYSVIERR